MKLIYLTYSFHSSVLLLFVTIISQANSAFAQDSNIVPDNTLGAESSVVNTRDETSESINGGALRGSNLFHSFQEFNVGADTGVYFSNPDAVSNIFSRVTGGNVSNILGTLGVDGAADLYLINPNGIVFGEGASLDVQGSFTATTADAIEFGEASLFSAVEPGESLLTISVPLGLQFGSTPESIVNRSYIEDETGEFVGLQVPNGENLTLVGGEVRFEAGEATAKGGNINIGGLGAAGTVDINNNGSLSFPEDVERADIIFSNAADVDVRGTGGGNINLHARNLDIEAGNFGFSEIRAGISTDSTSPEAQAGNITIDATDNLSVTDSTILNKVDFQGVGNAGNIQIDTNSLTLNDGGRISTTTEGTGNAGEIDITASNSIIIDGISSDLDECVFCENSDGSNSGVFSLADSDASGNAGGITINASSLTLTNGGRIDATTSSQGDAGKIDITATDSVTINGADMVDLSGGFSDPDFLRNAFIAGSPSAIFSQVNSTAVGNTEGITISANTLNLTNGGRIDASTEGQGNAGKIDLNIANNITIDGADIEGSPSGVFSRVNSSAVGNAENINIFANTLNLDNGGQINASTSGQGSSGKINIVTADNITISNSSAISSRVNFEGIGNAAGITISTADSLAVSNGGRIDASTLGKGDAGNIKITATDSVAFDGEDSDGFLNSGAIGAVGSEATGSGGNIEIDTSFLTLTNGGGISTTTEGEGNAGEIKITATNTIIFDGETTKGFPSSAVSVIAPRAKGNSGGITVSTDSLTLTNGGKINASTFGQGNAGKIAIAASDVVAVDGEDSNGNSSGFFSVVTFDASGNSGGISVISDSLNFTNGGRINGNTFGQGDAGKIEIITAENITFDGADADGFSGGAFSTVGSGASGNSGGISVTTDSLNLINGGQVNASTFGEGDAGAIVINTSGMLSADGESPNGFSSGILSLVEESGIGDSGGIDIKATNIALTQGSRISASTLGEGNAGAVVVNADESISIDGKRTDGFNSVISSVAASGIGDSGGINITTTNLSLSQGGQVNASTLGEGDAGAIIINGKGSISIDGEGSDEFNSAILSQVAESGIGNSDGITITTNSLTLTKGRIDVSTFGQGKAGELEINANSLNLDNSAFIVSRSVTDFDAGDITLNIASSLQAIDSEISTNSTQSLGGNLTVTADNIQLRGDSDITTNIFSGRGSGGNIILNANSILTFDDSDIFAFAPEGKGGNILLNTPAFFAENFTLNSLTADPDNLDLNGRANVNATGAVSSGAVNIPDVSFIQNSLTELPDNSINTDELVANSCVVPAGDRSQGKFIITGGESLPVRPGDNLPSKYPTGEVRGVTEVNTSSWQSGDPIVEPQGAYRLANGKMVLSRECPQ